MFAVDHIHTYEFAHLHRCLQVVTNIYICVGMFCSYMAGWIYNLLLTTTRQVWGVALRAGCTSVCETICCACVDLPCVIDFATHFVIGPACNVGGANWITRPSRPEGRIAHGAGLNSVLSESRCIFMTSLDYRSMRLLCYYSRRRTFCFLQLTYYRGLD